MGSIRISGVEGDGEVELEIDEASEPSTATRSSSATACGSSSTRSPREALADQVIGVDAHGDHFHFTFDDQPA